MIARTSSLFVRALCIQTLALCLFGTSRAWYVEPDADHPPLLSPEESAKRFKVAEGLAISLVVAEPEVSQPLSISFDDRGRMWVLQYRQYPNPNGLKAVKMDNWLRTKYDCYPCPRSKEMQAGLPGPHGIKSVSPRSPVRERSAEGTDVLANVATR